MESFFIIKQKKKLRKNRSGSLIFVQLLNKLIRL